MGHIRNIWLEYGFLMNPYHTDHLDATREDAALYIHRETEETRLGNFLASEDHGAIFVEGHVGVGKTTFVNQTQYILMQDGSLPQILPSCSVVEVQNTSTSEELVFSIISSVLRALRLYSPGVEDSNIFREIESYTWQAQITSWTASASIMGTGGGIGRTTTPTQPVAISLQTLQNLLDKASILASERGFERIVILINNLDNVNETHFFSLLHDLRDSILGRRRWLFVMAGPTGMRRSLLRSTIHRRISERIASEVVKLDPLNLDGIFEVIKKRVEHFRKQESIKAPVPEKIIEILYNASRGEIRYVLNRANGIARMVAQEFTGTGPIQENLALAALQKLISDEVRANDLTERQWEVLEAIVHAGNVRPKNHDSFNLNSAQAFINYLNRFHRLGLIEQERFGRETLYTPRGDITLFFKGISL